MKENGIQEMVKARTDSLQIAIMKFVMQELENKKIPYSAIAVFLNKSMSELELLINGDIRITLDEIMTLGQIMGLTFTGNFRKSVPEKLH